MAEKTRGDIFITVRSKDLTNLNTEGSSGRFVLFENIIADHSEILSIKCVSAIIPNSFSNISAHNNNNKLRFSEAGGGGEQTITIPDGSYDILELEKGFNTIDLYKKLSINSDEKIIDNCFLQ